MVIPQGSRNRNTIFPSNPITTHLNPKDYKSFYYKNAYIHVYCGTVHNSKDLEPTQLPINDRLDKENVVHIHNEILCSHKKE